MNSTTLVPTFFGSRLSPAVSGVSRDNAPAWAQYSLPAFPSRRLSQNSSVRGHQNTADQLIACSGPAIDRARVPVHVHVQPVRVFPKDQESLHSTVQSCAASAA